MFCEIIDEWEYDEFFKDKDMADIGTALAEIEQHTSNTSLVCLRFEDKVVDFNKLKQYYEKKYGKLKRLY